MSRSREGSDADLLFDLPLDPAAGEPADAADEAADGEQVTLAFLPEEAPQPEPTRAPVGRRFLAGLLDLVALAAVLGLALVALRVLAVPVGRGGLAPLALFLASFSFLYQVMPLAFWGHTPGMAYAGIHSRGRDGDFMTIQQCILRWVGFLLTLVTGGLGALVALSDVSLSDLLSRTRTYLRTA